MDSKSYRERNPSEVLNRLAIVIPAYKGRFLEKTLSSLKEQTVKNFNLYIGNDAGDEEIDEIISAYKNDLNIIYKKFQQNLGRTSLVQQWNRCLGLLENEEWLWLLPDDDYPDKNCVGEFYKNVNEKDFDVFRFQVRNIDEQENILKENSLLPEVQPSFEALVEKLSFIRNSSVAEYIFKKSAFKRIAGFREIPMAWGADDLLWFRLGYNKGIAAINNSCVNIRTSAYNISGDYTKDTAKKIEANFLFFSLLKNSEEFQSIDLQTKDQLQFNKVAMNHIMLNLRDFKMKVPVKHLMRYAKFGNRIWGGGVLKNMRRFFLNNQRIK